MSISQNFPNTRPSLNLNFARSKTLDPRITFTRTSTGTYVDESGVIRNAVADEPRFDHDPVTGECLGLLIEEQRTNSLYYSNDFSQNPPVGALQGWLKQNSHPVPTQSVVGPDGVSNSGWRFYRTATNQYIYQQVAGAGTHTLSAWVRSSAATGSFTMQGYNGTDGTMGTEFTATNEWKRFSITISPTTTTNYYPCIPTNTNEDFYVWGAQLELNVSFPTSYIPTSGSTVTRTKEYPTISGTDFTDFYNPSEGTLYVRYSMKGYYATDGFNRIFEISDGGSTNRFSALLRGINDDIYEGAVWGINFNTSLITFGDFYTYIVGYKENDFQRYAIDRNGNIDSNTDTSVEVSSFIPTELNIGYQADGDSRQLDGHISQLTYYPVRLPNSQLQTLTK